MSNVIPLRNTGGFTRMDNDLLDALAAHSFTITERKVIDVVLRLTAGYQRETARITGKTFEERTGKKRNHVSEAVDSLLRRGVIFRIGGSAGEIGINNPSVWAEKSTTKKEGISPKFGTDKVREIGPHIKIKENITANAVVAADASTGEVSEYEPEQQGTPEPDQPAPAKADRIPYSKIVEIYNAVCGGVLPKCVKLSPKRKNLIKGCWNLEINGIHPFRKGEFWTAYFTDCLTNKHWTGDNDRGWTADIEFLTRQDKVLKVLEAL